MANTMNSDDVSALLAEVSAPPEVYIPEGAPPLVVAPEATPATEVKRAKRRIPVKSAQPTPEVVAPTETSTDTAEVKALKARIKELEDEVKKMKDAIVAKALKRKASSEARKKAKADGSYQPRKSKKALEQEERIRQIAKEEIAKAGGSVAPDADEEADEDDEEEKSDAEADE